MSVVLPYNELHTQLTPEQNQAALEKVAAIIKSHQTRSFGVLPGTEWDGKSMTLTYNSEDSFEEEMHKFMNRADPLRPSGNTYYIGLGQYLELKRLAEEWRRQVQENRGEKQ